MTAIAFNCYIVTLPDAEDREVGYEVIVHPVEGHNTFVDAPKFSRIYVPQGGLRLTVRGYGKWETRLRRWMGHPLKRWALQ